MPELVAVNLDTRLARWSDGSETTIDMIVDSYGDETDLPDEAYYISLVRPDGRWTVIKLGERVTAKELN